MNNSTNHHRLYLVLGWLAPLAATLAWAAVTATHMDHRSPHSESWVASVCLRKILFCPSVSCCQSVISSARRDPFNDDVVDISKYLKFIYFYIQLLLSSYGTISLELYRSNTDRFFPIFLILIFFLVQTNSYYPSKYGTTIRWAHFAFFAWFQKKVM